jgi:hypothetical protein
MGGRQVSDNLSQLSDAELTEVFAVEVAGWTPHAVEEKKCHDPEGLSCYWSDVPPFAMSANDVLPWLEKHKCTVPSWAEGSWSVTIYDETGEGETYDMPILGEEDDKSFARAAATALIRAKRAQTP